MKKRFIRIRNIVIFAANISIIIGVFFAFLEIKQLNTSEKRKFSVEAISQTRTFEFLEIFSRVRNNYRQQTVATSKRFQNDLNYILNIYDNIAILCKNDLIEKCIIKEAIFDAVKELKYILDTIQYPTSQRKNFENFLKELNNSNCTKYKWRQK